MSLIFPKNLINHESNSFPEHFRVFLELPQNILIETIHFSVYIMNTPFNHLRKVIQAVLSLSSGILKISRSRSHTSSLALKRFHTLQIILSFAKHLSLILIALNIVLLSFISKSHHTSFVIEVGVVPLLSLKLVLMISSRLMVVIVPLWDSTGVDIWLSFAGVGSAGKSCIFLEESKKGSLIITHSYYLYDFILEH